MHAQYLELPDPGRTLGETLNPTTPDYYLIGRTRTEEMSQIGMLYAYSMVFASWN